MRWLESIFFILTIVTAEPNDKSLTLGAACIGLGVLLFVWIQGLSRSEKPGSIVGPYRFVQNPKRLSFFLLCLGLSISARSLPAMLLSLAFLPILHHLKIARQKSLSSMSGLAALRYKQLVPMLVPSFFPYRASEVRSRSDRQAYSWRRALFAIEAPERRLLLLVAGAWSFCFFSSRGWVPSWMSLALGALTLLIEMWFHSRNKPAQNHESGQG